MTVYIVQLSARLLGVGLASSALRDSAILVPVGNLNAANLFSGESRLMSMGTGHFILFGL